LSNTKLALQHKLSEEEVQKLSEIFEDKEAFVRFTESMSMLIRAFEGRPIDARDIITSLTNIKNILERSRFPTYPLLAKQVYLRLIAKYIPEASSCKEWADIEAEALISYKGLSRAENVEICKAATGAQEQQQFYFGEKGSPMQPKRRFWERKPKEEPSEFVSQ